MQGFPQSNASSSPVAAQKEGCDQKGGVGAGGCYLAVLVHTTVMVDILIVHTSGMSFSCRAQDTRRSGHVLPLHTRRESCAARSHHGQNPGDEEGMAPWRGDICCPCSLHIFLSSSSSGSPERHRLLCAGCAKSCWQGSGLSFSSNGHDSLTLFWLGGLSFSMTIFHSSLQPLRKWLLFLITGSQAEGTRGLGLWSWARGLKIPPSQFGANGFTSLYFGLPFGKEKQSLPLACFNRECVSAPLIVLKMTIFTM